MTISQEDLNRLASVRTVDLTTYGRRTGLPRRIEIWWFRVDDRFLVTGTPGPRDWVANVASDSRVIVHVNGWDMEATASLVHDREFRRRVFTQPSTSWYSTQEQLDLLIETAPMIELHLDSDRNHRPEPLEE